ncbi:MAG: SpoIID/LytB domain-containing protein, partial [Actinomycetota bacterium]
MRRVLLATLLITLTLPLVPAAAQNGAPIGAPVRFAPKDGTLLALDGPGPLRGSIEVRRQGAALTVVNELDLDHYVMGVREVPGLWPMEALKAQAVAARTYALWEVQKGYWNRFGFDVCATVSCQVYQGAAAEEGERGQRWRNAVEATAGQVLLDAEGRPALTRYYSSSGGRTLPNEMPFPDDGPRPYLIGVDDEPDKVSPLHTWTVRFQREHLERILRDAIELQGTLVNVRSNQTTRKLVISTEGGTLEMPTSRFRSEVSEHAPRIYPSIYPGRRNDGERLPMSLPSSRLDVTKTENGLVLEGRGYGHGVGDGAGLAGGDQAG